MAPASPALCTRRTKIEKEKKEHARLHGMIRTEISGAEIAEEMEKERRFFQLQMCEVRRGRGDLALPGDSPTVGVGWRCRPRRPGWEGLSVGREERMESVSRENPASENEGLLP